MEKHVTIIQGAFFKIPDGKLIYLIAVAPKNMSAEKIMQKGLEEQVIENIPQNYSTQIIDLSDYRSEEFNSNVILLVIP